MMDHGFMMFYDFTLLPARPIPWKLLDSKCSQQQVDTRKSPNDSYHFTQKKQKVSHHD